MECIAERDCFALDVRVGCVAAKRQGCFLEDHLPQRAQSTQSLFYFFSVTLVVSVVKALRNSWLFQTVRG